MATPDDTGQGRWGIPLHQQALAWGIKDTVKLVQLRDNVFVWDWVTVKDNANGRNASAQ